MVGASHFTLQCGRRLPDGSYQAPVVAMVASFSSSTRGLLSPEQAQTLFHEFGHALHSLLSRTEFQHHFGASGLPDVPKVDLCRNARTSFHQGMSFAHAFCALRFWCQLGLQAGCDAMSGVVGQLCTMHIR